MSEASPSTLALTPATSVNAYTDESGNTGDDVFNADQPDFYTLTLLSKEDLNVLVAPHVTRWSHELSVTELHGSELGVGRLESIAGSMLSFVMETRPLFVLTVVEKRHLVTMKLIDLIFDSGVNDAVSPIHYSSRFLRLGLADIVADHLSPKGQIEFWRSYAQQDGDGLGQILHRLRWNIDNRCKDWRARQLILEAIDWAARNIAVFVKYPRGPGDCPNVVAFSLLLHGLHGILDGAGLRVARFVHDEQNQFAKTFDWLYECVRRGRHVEREPFLFPQLVEESSYDCPLTMEASHREPALQFVDVLLWLMVRKLKGRGIGPRCEALLTPFVVTGMVNSFTRRQLSREVAELKNSIMSRPLTAADLDRGAALRDQYEALRLARAK